VKVTLVPAQNVLSASEELNETTGKALTVLVIPDVVAVQPAAFVAVQVTICPLPMPLDV
jgi:hypothetical protein